MLNPLRYLTAIRAAFALRAASRASKRGLKCDLPGRIKILNWGANPSTSGNVWVGEKSAERLAANQVRHGLERVPIDYNHCTVPGSEEYKRFRKAGRAPIIFGYGHVNLIPGDGVWLENMEWTQVGLREARNFEDLSPAFTFECGEVDFIHSVALPDARTHLRMIAASAEKNAAPRSPGSGNKAT